MIDAGDFSWLSQVKYTQNKSENTDRIFWIPIVQWMVAVRFANARILYIHFRVRKCTAQDTLPEGLVIATQFFYVRKADNRLVGMIQVRHYFNDYLSKFGGHIGYSIRPSERRKGYATSMLNAILPYCREIGLDKLLITCIDGNIGSEKTIRNNGGVYESTVYESGKNCSLKRFWITL